MVRLVQCLIVLIVVPLSGPRAQAETDAFDLVIRGGTVIDGTGAAARRADLGIRGDRIVAIGTIDDDNGGRVVDATGLIVAPGFIDLHTHADHSILEPETRSNRNYQAQGVTTIVTGNCGSGPVDVGAYLEGVDAKGAGCNVIHLVPLGDVRREVMGNEDRPPSPVELRRMEQIVAEGMDDGAWGISSGLIYIPGRYADTDELTALAAVAAESGGIYASHIRDEGTGLLQSIDEAIAIGAKSGAPVHISHLKAGGRDAWGLVGPACDRIERARAAGQAVTADQYPYVASSTSLGAMVVPDWSIREGDEVFGRIADDPERGAGLRREIREALVSRNGGESIRLARYEPRPEWVGLDLASIAKGAETPVEEIVVEIQRNGGASAISFSMDEADVRYVMARDFVATASDGSGHRPETENRPHPRSFGTFPRKLRYAMDDGILSIEAAIRSASGLPASILRIPDRGVLRVGAFADVVVFEPETFRDLATFDAPTRYAEGLKLLLVNGKAVMDDGSFNDALPGRALRRDRDGPPDLVVNAGRIWTGDPENPWAESVASRGGVIVAVGSAEEIRGLAGPGTRVLEWPDGFATPGLIDAHAHLAMLGESLESVDLRGVDSLEAVQRLVAERADTLPENAWLLGSNWDQSLWGDGEFPTSSVLDAACPDRPVWLRRIDGHAGWANTAAMRRAGINAETESPSDGQIIRDPSGLPTGIFVDGATGLVDRVVPAESDSDLQRRLLLAQEAALAAGLTGVHDAGVPPRTEATFRALDAEGLLKLRVYGMANVAEGVEIERLGEPPDAAEPGDRFRLRAVKFFIDGAMGSSGALLFEPYEDDPSNLGLSLIDPGRLRAASIAALENGWQVCTHAIGDRGNALVLDAYEAALEAVPDADDPRLRVEHAQVVRPADVERFAAHGIIASMQPSHASSDMRWADRRLGPDRVLGAYAWRWFRDSGVPMAFGSDFPVEVVSPFWGLYAAVTRKDLRGEPPGGWHAEHLLSLHEALRGFTAGAAFASFDEGRLGALKPGYRADLTIIDRDPFDGPPSDLLDVEVLGTIIDGELVHRTNDR